MNILVTLFAFWLLWQLKKLVTYNNLYPMRHMAYGKYVLRHKWYVLQEGMKLGVPLWMLILHDWDKFLPDEWFPYAENFWSEDGTSQYLNTSDFATAWNHHQKRNKHHWQYWIITWDKGNTECLPIPEIYLREMLADWRGAGRAITGEDNTLQWYTDNRDYIKLHPDSRAWIESHVGYSSDQ